MIEGLKPGRIVYVRNGGMDVPAMVTRVVDADKGVIHCSCIEDGEAQLHPYRDVPMGIDKDQQDIVYWHWMFEGQATSRTNDAKDQAEPAMPKPPLSNLVGTAPPPAKKAKGKGK